MNVMVRNLLTGSFVFAALVAEAATAFASWRDARTSVIVVARGPAGLRIEGRGAEVSVEHQPSALLFKVPLAPLETGIALRDAQLRTMLEADKYPTAVLRVSRAALTLPSGHAPIEGTAEADLMLHGQSRPVRVRYRAARDAAGKARVSGSFLLDIRDFDIPTPSYLGLPLAPRVEVTAELDVKGA